MQFSILMKNEGNGHLAVIKSESASKELTVYFEQQQR
jgi:hypothetical protein